MFDVSFVFQRLQELWDRGEHMSDRHVHPLLLSWAARRGRSCILPIIFFKMCSLLRKFDRINGISNYFCRILKTNSFTVIIPLPCLLGFVASSRRPVIHFRVSFSGDFMKKFSCFHCSNHWHDKTIFTWWKKTSSLMKKKRHHWSLYSPD